MSSDYDVDVLIAGAGPVGLTAALQLARWGVDVRVVDIKEGPATTSRALNTHSRTLEVYDQMGILGDIAPFGIRVNAFVRHLEDGPFRLEYDYDGLATRFPYMFMVDQVITERVLRGHAAVAGVTVEWDTGLSSFTQDDEGVRAVLNHAGGAEEIVRAKYLWGCDGGHSLVRKTLKLPLQGESTYTWLIADAIVDTPVARDGLHWMFPPEGLVMLFPFPDPHKWRLLDTTGEGDPDRPEEVAARFSAKFSQALGRETRVETPTWVSTFTIQQRAVPAMHVGRCFVSGDAAHVHSPASGQGMNTSIQDAYNLAWKLAMVLHGQADPDLLETYDAERVPVGQALLASTGEVMEVAMTTEEDGRDSDYAFLRQLIRGMSGLALNYADSPLTVGGDTVPDATGPRPGERLTQVDAADADTPGWTALRGAIRQPSWHLLVFAPAEPPHDAPAWLRTHLISPHRPENDRAPGSAATIHDPDQRLHQTLGAGAGDWILVRPDGYLAARGGDFTPETFGRVLACIPHLRLDIGDGSGR
ncbi:FAD-dependent monooxygenase [Actinoallomurus rhizosphaericola]|uniref:FAD-dependent monooxygenase n=1 Tax=Actinoallomurus rhizosphaericola TaxID=2952536 RepID=UPI0020920858|nr:FAD-dependent monooxygenase [Actinoallomurus rhizosphaericola]MCO5998980.1 FAD-dependent monooxygenase [Actinoallomurus rhizosphaericola]